MQGNTSIANAMRGAAALPPDIQRADFIKLRPTTAASHVCNSKIFGDGDGWGDCGGLVITDRDSPVTPGK